MRLSQLSGVLVNLNETDSCRQGQAVGEVGLHKKAGPYAQKDVGPAVEGRFAIETAEIERMSRREAQEGVPGL